MTSLLIKMDVNAGLNFRGTKLSRMAVEPRKPRKFSTAKIKVHTVCQLFYYNHILCVCVYIVAHHSACPSCVYIYTCIHGHVAISCISLMDQVCVVVCLCVSTYILSRSVEV